MTTLSPAKRVLLERRLRGEASSAPVGAASSLRRLGLAEAPLTIGQEQIWFLDQLMPGKIAYNEAITVARKGSFVPVAFERAFGELVRRHESLRTSFRMRNGEPVQVVNPPPAFVLEPVDLRSMPRAEREAEATRMATAEARRPYNLREGPLVRPLVVRLDDDDHRLFLAMHHIVFDGVALYRVIVPELIALYHAFAEGRPPLLLDPPLQFADYAHWQREQRHADPDTAGRLDYWRRQLARLPGPQLPIDHPRPREASFEGDMRTMSFGRDASQAVIDLAKREQVSLFQTLMAAYHLLVHRYSGQDDVVIATVSDGRRDRRLEDVVGYFLNPLVLRTDFSGRPSFRELLVQVRDLTLAGLANEVPLPDLVRELHPQRDLSHNPLFQVLFSLEPPLALLERGWEFRQMDVLMGTAKFDLYLEQDQREDGIIGRFVYDRQLFDGTTIERMCGHWNTLLTSLAAAPDTPVDSLAMMPAGERRALVGGWNRTETDFPRDACIQDLVEAQAKRTPHNIAVEFGAQRLTYSELDRRAGDLASRLRARGAGPERLIGVCLERSPEMVIGLLAVLKSGAAYVPLDPAFPDERIDFMLRDSGAALVVAGSDRRDRLVAAGFKVVGVDEAESERAPAEGTAAGVGPGNLSYVIYTSGSTGRPKGVMIEHRAVVNHLAALVRDYGIGPDDVVLQLPSISFHPSVRDIFGTLCAGARLVLLPEAEAKDPRVILDRLTAGTVTCLLSLVPSLLKGVLAELARRGGEPAPLRLVLTCGESLPVSDAAELVERFRCRVANQFGPTECIMAATAHEYGEADTGRAEVLAGRPIANARVYVLDTSGELQPLGVPGELFVGGESLARGYLNQPELTAERFVHDPFVGSREAQMDRTGDFARLRPDGLLEFLGRRDSQVKVRGYRVELGEVEARMEEHPAVIEAAATIAPDPLFGERLVAGFVAGTGSPLDPAELRTHLKAQLPEYMVPAVLVALDSLPRTPGGKVDRRALAATAGASIAERRPLVAPRTALEDELARLWGQILGLETVGVDDDFFTLGGHSLLAVRLLAEVEGTFGRRIPLASFVRRGSTVAALAEIVAEATPDIGGLVSPLVFPVRAAGHLPPLFFIHSDEMGALTLRHFTDALEQERPLIGLLPERVERRFDRTTNVDVLASGLVAALRELQASGPYHLAGHSFGGLLAYEVAAHLAAAGEEVGFLVLLDATTPAATDRHLRQHMSLGERLRRQRQRGLAGATIKTVEVLRRETGRLLGRLGKIPLAPIGTYEFDHEGAIHLTLRYRPAGHAIPMTIFTTEAAEIACADPWLGWRQVHGGPLQRHRVPGDHLTMLQPPNVALLASELGKILNSAAYLHASTEVAS